MNEADDFFGEERLYAIAQQTSGQPVSAIGARILEGVATFVGHAAVSDDVSLMILRRR